MTLTVTTPATDYSLLTLAELRSAVGVTGTSKDTELRTLGNRVAALMAKACNIPSSGAYPPTLRLETLTETFRSSGYLNAIMLSRSPVVSIISLTEIDTVLGTTDYDNSAGFIQRLSSGIPTIWASGVTTVVYQAGWATVPHDLRELASKLALLLWSEKGKDPSLGSVDIPGVISETYRYGRPDDPLIPAEIMEGLQRGNYVKIWI